MNLESDQFDANRGNGHTDAASTGVTHSSRVAGRSDSGTGRRIVVGAITLLIVLAIAFGIGLWFRHRHAQELAATDEQMADTPPAVAVAAVHRAEQRKILTLPAEARAMNETTLYARTNGYINKWLVDIGDKVKRGQTLAIIDTPELDEQLNAAQAKVSQSKSEASLSVQSAKFAKVTFDRWQAAQPEGVVSEQERDEKSAELDTANAKVAAANAQVAVDEAEVHRLETMVSFKNVTAPFDGTITQRHIDIGDLVTSGSSSNTTSLFSIAASDQLRVFVDVPQVAIPEITVGMKASVAAREFPNRTFSGTVDRTAGALSRSSRTMEVEVIVPNSDNLLKPNDYVEVSFQTERQNPPLEIPSSALVMKPDGPEVAVVDADSKVNFHKIKIAQDMGSYVEVATGLEDGDRVALNIGDIAEGEQITAHDLPPEAETAVPKTASADTSPTDSKPAAPATASVEAR